MRGIIRAAGYVPYRRLEGADVGAFFGSGGQRTSRAVASHDEDTTTMGVEAARLAMAGGTEVDRLTFATPTPAYADKNNASTIHAALRLPGSVGAYDVGGSLRSWAGALLGALDGGGQALVVVADLRDGLPTSADEVVCGDAAAAVLVGEGSDAAPVIAEVLGRAAATDEFLDRWRAPGDRRSRVWEERFGETRYATLAASAAAAALADAGIDADSVDRVLVAGMHVRAVKAAAATLAGGRDVAVDAITPAVGLTGGAHPLLLLAASLEEAGPGQTILLLGLADGADALVVRTTDAIAGYRAADPIAAQIANGATLPYAKFLAWRGSLEVEPPRRPSPDRVSSSAAWRNEDWKFGFVGAKDPATGRISLPPTRVSRATGALDAMEQVPMADALGTVVTFTVDRMAYSPSPPIVFAVVDFDGGGRFPVELTDADATAVAIGDRVAMTFRRLFTADGIHDYFWKGRPVRSTTNAEEA
jgi:3-hydroxy-3-methylglutaryl CoA synthase/uncharacterized OB-fold protein